MKDTSGLAFNGQGGDGYSRNNSAKVQVNQHTGHMNDGRTVNFGRGPTVGNKSDKDSSYPKADSIPAFKPGKDMFMASSNPQVRTPGGTRSWDPSKEQNYKGNADRMNVGRGPTKGNQK
jgi:hypothetical protein